MSLFRIANFRFAIKRFDRVDLSLRNLGLPLSDGSVISLTVVVSFWFNRYTVLDTRLKYRMKLL